MTGDKKELGQEGERLAAEYLQRQGYHVLETNYRNRLGEIDIIAQDGPTLCFIEVRSRTKTCYGHPFESISPAKQRKIIRAAKAYLAREDSMDIDARFDAVAVIPQETGGYTIELLKDAFEAGQ